MTRAMKAALLRYGDAIDRGGWDAGEVLIQKYERTWKDFRKWAYALGIVLRAKEMLKPQRKAEEE